MVPLGVLAILFFNLAVFFDPDFSWWMIPWVILLALVYIMSPQIDWWWYQKHPPKLPEPLVRLLMAKLPFFQQLSNAEKTKFCTRMAMYIEANEMRKQGPDADPIPEDIKAVVAASVVQLTFGMEDYLLNKFEHIIVYPHPFPSPQFKRWHACENFPPDGVILFSAEQLMAGFAAPQKFFHIGLYEYTKVMKICHPGLKFPEWGKDIWDKLAAVSNFPKEAIEKWVGLPDLDVDAVAVAHYFIFPEKFKALMPREYEGLASLLGQRL